jgi:hypothetical protein
MITERMRLEHVLGPVEALFGLSLPTRLVHYRLEGSKTSKLGALYMDESLDDDPDRRWALTTSDPTGPGLTNWLFRETRAKRGVH